MQPAARQAGPSYHQRRHRSCWSEDPMRPITAVVLVSLAMATGTAAAGGLRRGAVPPAERTASGPPARASADVATVIGRVTSPAGEAVGGVTVLAADVRSQDRPHRRVQSDRAGQFRFALPPGEYVFLALDRDLAGSTTPMTVARALEVVLVVSPAALST
ncbi:MAG: carboxypeptidase-like regulatory domain-containing protein [Kofleriaceae bacterium]